MNLNTLLLCILLNMYTKQTYSINFKESACNTIIKTHYAVLLLLVEIQYVYVFGPTSDWSLYLLFGHLLIIKLSIVIPRCCVILE